MTGSRADRALSSLLQDQRAVVVLTGLFVLAGLVFIATDYTLHDEGLYTYMMADWLRRDFVPVLFWQKSRPILSLLYLPSAAIGLRVMLAMHLVVAATAIPMIAAVARALGRELPNFPALVLALSPAFLLTAPAGISNSDIVTGLSLALYLLISRRASFAAGLVLGALPWVRNESALIAGVIVALEWLGRRNHRLALGAVVFPAVYGLAGAVYHHDLLWLLHFPPALAQPMPNNPIWEYVTPGRVLGAFLVLTPVFGVLLTGRPRQWNATEWWLYSVAFGWLVLATVMPVWKIANFGFIPRYFLQTLPLLALLAGRAIEALWHADRSLRPSLLGIAVVTALIVLWGVSGFSNLGASLPILAGYAGVLALAYAGRGVAAAWVLTCIVLAGPLLPLPTEIPSRDRSATFPAIGDWLNTHKSKSGLILTNAPLLAPTLRRSSDRANLDVRFLVGVDHEFETKHTADESVGQWTVLRRLLEEETDDSPGVLPENVEIEKIAPGTLFVFRQDDRLDMLMPPATWAGHLNTVWEQGRYRIAEFSK